MTNKVFQKFTEYLMTGKVDPNNLSPKEIKLLLQLVITEAAYSDEEEDAKDPIIKKE